MIKSHLSTAWDGLHSREVKPSAPHFLQENIKRLQSDRTHSTTDQNTRGITVLHMLMIIMYYISNPLLQVCYMIRQVYLHPHERWRRDRQLVFMDMNSSMSPAETHTGKWSFFQKITLSLDTKRWMNIINISIANIYFCSLALKYFIA